MENTTHTHDDRLRAHGLRLLNALEAQPAPETYADILKAARALIAVKKALDLLHKDIGETETKAAAPAEADSAEPPVLNRQMRRMAEALARKQAKAGDYRRIGSG